MNHAQLIRVPTHTAEKIRKVRQTEGQLRFTSLHARQLAHALGSASRGSGKSYTVAHTVKDLDERANDRRLTRSGAARQYHYTALKGC